jgi:hypothetical protein
MMTVLHFLEFRVSYTSFHITDGNVTMATKRALLIGMSPLLHLTRSSAAGHTFQVQDFHNLKLECFFSVVPICCSRCRPDGQSDTLCNPRPAVT